MTDSKYFHSLSGLGTTQRFGEIRSLLERGRVDLEAPLKILGEERDGERRQELEKFAHDKLRSRSDGEPSTWGSQEAEAPLMPTPRRGTSGRGLGWDIWAFAWSARRWGRAYVLDHPGKPVDLREEASAWLTECLAIQLEGLSARPWGFGAGRSSRVASYL